MKTTNWTEATRNQFHPGDVIAALHRDYFSFSPSGTVGLAELVCHLTGEGREACHQHIDDDGKIHGFNYNVLTRAVGCEAYLRKQFPDLAELSDMYIKWDVKKIVDTDEKTATLIKKIEELYGKTVTVKPIKNYDRNLTRTLQSELLKKLSEKGVSSIIFKNREDTNEFMKKFNKE